MYGGIKKNRWFYGGIIGTWLLCLVHFDPKLFSVVNADDSFIAKGVFAIFVFFLNLFWLYGIFHCYFLIYGFVSKRKPAFFKRNCSISSPVAILYATRNDFQTKSALSCLQQTYPNFHLFILDDSTEDSYKKKVDGFHNEFRTLTTVIRRKDRKGFKAGNLNSALRYYVTGYDYFAIIDADEVVSPYFIEKLMPYFGLDENIAFVQAHHEQNAVQPSKFAQDLSLGINFHWDIYQPPRNDCGF
ncbi:MAG: glycosyltransferase, partial [Nitrospirota bacterium]